MNHCKKIIYIAMIMLALNFFALPDKAEASSAPRLPVVAQDTPGKSAVKTNIKKPKNQPKVQKKYKKNIFIGDSSSLMLKGQLDDYEVTFKSSNSSILNVTQVSPYVCDYYGSTAGTANIIIRIKSKNGLFFMNKTTTIKAKVVVSPWAASVKFQRSKYKITVGKSKKIHTTIRPSISKEKPIYESQNTQIATISNKGVVKARREGTTYIIATLHNGIHAKCKIIVKKSNPNK
ncbi:MAG: Ig-like domain-containing protein [Lachnospiraceae bacterium]|nr:Ig-like domain-containing protein [Lachnospiraceae bacterium]